MGLRHKPFAFTKYGVLMLASVLKSETAIAVNKLTHLSQGIHALTDALDQLKDNSIIAFGDKNHKKRIVDIPLSSYNSSDFHKKR